MVLLPTLLQEPGLPAVVPGQASGFCDLAVGWSDSGANHHSQSALTLCTQSPTEAAAMASRVDCVCSALQGATLLRAAIPDLLEDSHAARGFLELQLLIAVNQLMPTIKGPNYTLLEFLGSPRASDTHL